MKQLIYLCLFICTLPCHSAESSFFGHKELTPINIKNEVDKRGSENVLNYIANSENLFAHFQEKIKEGNPQWLKLFLQLRQHPEAELGGHLDLFLAYAVGNNPEDTLDIIRQYQTIHKRYFEDNQLPSYATLICGNVIEDWRLGCDNTEESGIAKSAFNTLQKRQQTLEQFSSDEFVVERRECLQKIVKTKSFWKSYCK